MFDGQGKLKIDAFAGLTAKYHASVGDDSLQVRLDVPQSRFHSYNCLPIIYRHIYLILKLKIVEQKHNFLHEIIPLPSAMTLLNNRMPKYNNS